MNVQRIFRRNAPPQPTTGEPVERGPFQTAIDDVINFLLELTHRAGLVRMQILTMAILATWLLLAFITHSFDEWRLALIAVFNPAFVPEIQQPVTNLVLMILRGFLSWGTLGHLVAFALPFWLALQFAGIFLDDIYELKDIEVARRFITRAAFTWPSTGIIHIENGDVRPTDKRSTIYNIGGPGAVRVSLENVAVFEKVDGTPNLIGPTSGNRGFTRTLDGFESLRQVIDVRDLTVPIPDMYARTKDGIPITVQNIRLLFSVLRSSPYSTLSRPYSYSEKAILELVYNQAKGHWTNSIIGLVRSTLVRFISENTLAEIFATVGEPEIQRQIERQRTILEQADLTRKAEQATDFARPEGQEQSEGKPLETAAYTTANQIGVTKVPRPQISRRFYESFSRGFPQLASQRGVRLEWIDVGTWHPAQNATTVLAQHEDAARISAENLILGDRSVLDDLCRQEQAVELLRLIRQPIYRFYQLSKEDAGRDEIVASLVEEYLGALRAARDDFQKENTPMPAAVKQGLEHIMRYQRDYLKRTGGNFINGS